MLGTGLLPNRVTGAQGKSVMLPAGTSEAQTKDNLSTLMFRQGPVIILSNEGISKFPHISGEGYTDELHPGSILSDPCTRP